MISLILHNNRFSVISQTGSERDILAKLARECLLFKNPVMTDAENLARIKRWEVPRYIPNMLLMAQPAALNQVGYDDIPIGYLPEIKEWLIANVGKDKIKVSDLSTGSAKITGYTPAAMMMYSDKLRHYQNVIAGQVFKVRRAQAISMTGSGKTIIMSHVIAAHNMPTVILCHRRLLIKQWAKALAFISPDQDKPIIPYTLVSGKVTKGNCPILISTFQSIGNFSEKSEKALLSKAYRDPILGIKTAKLPAVGPEGLLKQNRLDELAEKGFDIKNSARLALVIDEAHIAPAFAYYNIANAFHPTVLYGCTATPFRKDGRHIYANALFSSRTFETDPESVLGHLARMRYITIPIDGYFNEKEIMTAITHEDAVMDAAKMKLVVGDPIRYSILLETIKSVAGAGLSCAVICGNNMWLTELLKDALDNSAVPCRCVLGSTKMPERDAAIADTISGVNKVLIATTTLDEGVDIPSLDAIVFAVPFSSKITAIQRAGRIARKSPGKERGFIIDFIDTAIPRLSAMGYARRAHIKRAFAIKELRTVTSDNVGNALEIQGE